MAVIESGVNIVLDVINAMGYPGIFLLMTLESLCIPIPSEVIITFGGTLVVMGGSLAIFGNPALGVLAVALVGTLGCAVGSLIAYYIGYKGGRPLILRYGRWIRLNEGHLDRTERWFLKYGDLAVFGSRLLPIVRTFISLPAGMAKMDVKRFMVISSIGSFIWCLGLAYVGVVLGQNWTVMTSIFRQLDILVILVAAVLLVWFILQRRKGHRSRDGDVQE